MGTTIDNIPHHVFLKLGAYTGSDLSINTIALKATVVQVGVTKTVPSMDIPFSGMLTGESTTVALNLGMAAKTIDITATVTEQTITRKFTTPNETVTVTMTAQEICQLIGSYVDSTTLQPFQNLNELIVLIPCKVDSNYEYYEDANTSIKVPLTFAARGDAGEYDNDFVALNTSFPTSETDTGVTGFIRSFTYSLEGGRDDIEITLNFEVAAVL